MLLVLPYFPVSLESPYNILLSFELSGPTSRACVLEYHSPFFQFTPSMKALAKPILLFPSELSLCNWKECIFYLCHIIYLCLPPLWLSFVYYILKTARPPSSSPRSWSNVKKWQLSCIAMSVPGKTQK